MAGLESKRKRAGKEVIIIVVLCILYIGHLGTETC